MAPLGGVGRLGRVAGAGYRPAEHQVAGDDVGPDNLLGDHVREHVLQVESEIIYRLN